MPLRYETIIGPDGTGLSQGQKQRILKLGTTKNVSYEKYGFMSRVQADF